MFFTLQKIEGFIINVDDFRDDAALLDQIVDELKPRYKLVFASKSGTDFSALRLTKDDVVVAESSFEKFMYQNVLRRAITKMGSAPSTTVFLCKDAGSLRSAHELLLGTILMHRHSVAPLERLKIFQQFPDFLVQDLEDLRVCLSGECLGFGGEFLAAPEGIFLFHEDDIKYHEYPLVPNLEHTDCPVHVAGRYFSPSDPRYSFHALSNRILHSKKNPGAQAECFAELISLGVWVATDGSFDAITRVPSRPSKVDRLALYLKAMPKAERFKSHNFYPASIQPELLKCPDDYPKLTTMDFKSRKTAVKGAFSADPQVEGKHIVLVDDVQTTGATLNECIRVLKAAGAAKISPLVLAYHPYTLQSLGLSVEQEIPCGPCDSHLIGKCNSKTGEPFFGCANWKFNDGINHAYKTFKDGIKTKMMLMEPRLLQLDNELESEGQSF